MIRKIVISDVRSAGALFLQRNKKLNVMPKNRLSLPAGKNLKTTLVEQPNRNQNRVFASSKCSEYEGYDYCTPLFP